MINCSGDYECQIYEHQIQISIVQGTMSAKYMNIKYRHQLCSEDDECQVYEH